MGGPSREALALRQQLGRDPNARPAQRQYNVGVWEQTHGSHEEAVRLFELALTLEPSYAVARLELARMYAELIDSSVDPPRWEDTETSSCVSVLRDADSIEVEINTASINGHFCLLEGRGGINAAGELVVETDQPLVLYGVGGEPIQGPRCWVRFSANNRQLSIAETWPSECGRNPEWCGGRGEMLGHAFDRTSRRRGARCTSYDEIRNR